MIEVTHNEWLEDLAQMYSLDDEGTVDELTQAERLDLPKCSVVGSSERLEQLFKSVMSTYHINLCSLISQKIGTGEPLQELLQDSWARQHFNLGDRQL
jgi:hypothetical protein